MKFLRRDWNRHSKLGKKRKSKQVWRSPKGRDNKMREKRKGYPKVVSIGYEKEKTVKGKIDGKEPITITKVSELNLVDGKNNKIAVIGRVGKKRKMEIAKKAQEKGIELANLNTKKFLKQAEFENKKKKETKDKRESKKKAREEKSKKKAENKTEDKEQGEGKETKSTEKTKSDGSGKVSEPKEEKKEQNKESEKEADNKKQGKNKDIKSTEKTKSGQENKE